MTFLELINESLISLKETPVTSFSDTTPADAHWGLDTMKRRVNTIHKEICAETECLVTNGSVNATSSTWEYALPSDCRTGGIIRAWRYDGSSKYYELKFANQAWVNAKRNEHRTDYDTDLVEYIFYSRAGYFGVWYGFDTDVTSGINLDYIATPTDMTLTTDTPFSGEAEFDPYHKTIVDGVVAWCKKDDGDNGYRLYEKSFERGKAMIIANITSPRGEDKIIRTQELD